MGICLSRSSGPVKKRQSKRLTNQSAAAAVNGGGSNRWARNRSSKRDDSVIQERALATAILLQQQLQNGGGSGAVPFDRSASLRYPNSNSKRNQPLPRSSSSRARSLTDPLLQPHQLVNRVSAYFSCLLYFYYLLSNPGICLICSSLFVHVIPFLWGINSYILNGCCIPIDRLDFRASCE